MERFAEFVLQNENNDTAKLLLSKDKYPGIDVVLAVNTILCRRKIKNKLPGWYAVPSLVYPDKLSAEQCSSGETAKYKASVADRLLRERNGGGRYRIADLTGGMGADSHAFASVAEKVLYNEMNPALSSAAEYNFRVLGADNIDVRNRCVVPGNASGDREDMSSVSVEELLADFRPDMIFLDPARRADNGRKVFLMEDCRPDILSLKEELLSCAGLVMVKLSPMADISMILGRLGKQCRELHVVASGGECKELLVVLDRDWEGECEILACCGGNLFAFKRSEEKAARAVFADSESDITGAGLLFEPDKSLMKAGAYNLICERLGLKKLGVSTHYYIVDKDVDIESVGRFGKVFGIIEAMPLNNRNIKKAGSEYPKAEVTARNIPMTSDLLRTRLGVKSSDDIHIFGLKCDMHEVSDNYLFVTSVLG